MHFDAKHIYLETQIHTATPQKLRLMLIEGAIRFARATQNAWQRHDFEAGLEALIRCREIVSELLSGVKTDGTSLTRQVSGVYLFLFSSLTEAQQTRDEHQLAAAIRVLEEDRETWQAVCQQMPDRVLDAPHTREELAPNIVAGSEVAQTERLCLDA